MRAVFASCSLLWVVSTFQMTAQQTNRYVIRFTDKVGTPYSIEEPKKFLSDRSLARRKKHDVAITAQDLPVSSQYLQGLRSLDLKVYFTSRWINAALVQMSEVRVSEVEALPYVSSVVLVAPGSRLQSEPGPVPNPLPSSPNKLDSSIRPLNYWQNSMLGVPNYAQYRTKGEGTIIAVMDGGFRGVDSSAYFYDLHKENRVIDTYDFVSNLTTGVSQRYSRIFCALYYSCVSGR